VKAAIGTGSVSGFAAKTADEKKPAAKKAAAPKAAAAPAAAGDDLTQITGVGPAAAKKLVAAGINTFADLAKVDVDSFDAVKVKPEWVAQAADLSK
jgi:large subunit ribosomal protein L21